MIWRSKKPFRVVIGRDVLGYYSTLFTAEMVAKRVGWRGEIQVRG